MLIKDLLRMAPELRSYGALPEMDPLTEEDSLQEAQLLGVQFDLLRRTAGLLFELRMALQLRETNTGVLVACGVTEFSWSADVPAAPLTAWAVGGSIPRNQNRLFDLTLGMWPGATLHLIAESAAFFTGDVPGLAEAPPDYVEDDDETVQAGIANWDSQFVPRRAVFLDPAPPQRG